MTIKDIADIQTGPFGSQLHKEDYVDDGTPIVTVEHLGKRIFTEQNLPGVSDEDKERLSRYILNEGDIVFSRVGSVDRCSYVDTNHEGWMFSGRCLRVRPKRIVYPLYLYYYFCLEEVKQYIRNIAVGATMPSINTKLLGEVPIELPDYKIQKVIADELSSLDSKIELNEEINENLEQQAHAIFNNMFPNVLNSNGNFILEQIITFSNGKKRPISAGSIPVYGGNGVLAYTSDANADNCVIIGRVGAYCGNTYLCTGKCWVSDNAIQAKSKTSDSQFFVYYLLAHANLPSRHIGTSQPLMTQGILNAIPVFLPHLSFIDKFNKTVAPLQRMMAYNSSESIKLASIRDTLLPYLMSGELDVSDIEL